MVLNIVSNRVPTFFALFQAKSYRANSFLKERMLFNKIDNVKPYLFWLLVSKWEVKPLIISFCIRIILQNKIVLLYLIVLETFISIVQVSTLKSWLKLVICCYVCNYMLVMARIVVWCMTEWEQVSYLRSLLQLN